MRRFSCDRHQIPFHAQAAINQLLNYKESRILNGTSDEYTCITRLFLCRGANTILFSSERGRSAARRFSIMDKGTPKEFPWESDVPQGSFWESLPNENVGRQFLRVFSAKEIGSLNLDDAAHLDQVTKLQMLESLILDRMKTQPLPDPPESLAADDFYNKWHRREFLLAHVQRSQGNERMAEAEQRYRTMIDIWGKRDDPNKKWPEDLGSIDNLFIILAQQDRFVEAEPLAKELIGLIRLEPDLGYGSPMNIGIMLKLMDILGKQGKYDEALALNSEAYTALEIMSQGVYAKYVDMQRKSLDEMKEALEQHSPWESGYLVIR